MLGLNPETASNTVELESSCGRRRRTWQHCDNVRLSAVQLSGHRVRGGHTDSGRAGIPEPRDLPVGKAGQKNQALI